MRSDHWSLELWIICIRWVAFLQAAMVWRCLWGLPRFDQCQILVTPRSKNKSTHIHDLAFEFILLGGRGSFKCASLVRSQIASSYCRPTRKHAPNMYTDIQPTLYATFVWMPWFGHVYMYGCIHVDMHICTCVYIYIYVYIYVYVYNDMYFWIYVLSVYMHAYVCSCIHHCIYASLYECIWPRVSVTRGLSRVGGTVVVGPRCRAPVQ